MRIVLASRNKKKIKELKSILSVVYADIEILSLDDIGYFDDTEESGSSFEENALIKAAIPAKAGFIGVADDSGLCVDALGGAPGIYSARYSGENATDASNNEKLLYELKKSVDTGRNAHFVCNIACVFPESFGSVCAHDSELYNDLTGKYSDITGSLSTFSVSGRADGIILEKARGENGFGYDPLFWVPELSKTFAELTDEEKNRISHRGNAMKKFTAAFGEILKGIK